MTYLKTFPAAKSRLSAAQSQSIAEQVRHRFQENLKQLDINPNLSSQLADIYVPLASSLADRAKQQQGPLIVGVNGAQGSGKSTLCTLLETILLEGFELKAASFSIDDLYYTRAERKILAEQIHPLLATRGVPGTHDVGLGLSLLDQLTVQEAGHQVAIPSFDKAIDDRAPAEKWPVASTPLDLILFEGWCVGAKPQDESALTLAVNALEANEDQDGIWRTYVNRKLQDEYAELFGRLDLLIMLKIPAMECVLEWRSLQERKLAAQREKTRATHIMSPAELDRFIMHYERLTRHMLNEMPEEADIVLRLDRGHKIDGVRFNRRCLTKEPSHNRSSW